LYTCLFAVAGLDIRSVLRDGSSDADLVEFLTAAWMQRDDRYSELRSQSTSDLPKIEMFAMGG
jgi:cyclic pyranopterin phosphate synthase